MHCPHCRCDNAATTRFCIECGAVLVESTPGGGRRRVLRPWGLRSSAPLTESPALPEMAAARKAARRASRGSRRPLYKIAAGIAGIVALSGVIAYPYTLREELSSFRGEEVTVKAEPQFVAIADLTAVKERLPGVTADPEPIPDAGAPAPKSPASVVEPAPRAPSRPPPVELTPSIVREPPTAEQPVEATPSPQPEPPRIPTDPWQPLRDALNACGRVQGLWDRATCEQRARLASCDGHWGAVSLCPAGRTEFGQ
jgi:hypothetical protein